MKKHKGDHKSKLPRSDKPSRKITSSGGDHAGKMPMQGVGNMAKAGRVGCMKE